MNAFKLQGERLSICKKTCIPHKAQNICYLALYRKFDDPFSKSRSTEIRRAQEREERQRKIAREGRRKRELMERGEIGAERLGNSHEEKHWKTRCLRRLLRVSLCNVHTIYSFGPPEKKVSVK